VEGAGSRAGPVRAIPRLEETPYILSSSFARSFEQSLFFISTGPSTSSASSSSAYFNQIQTRPPYSILFDLTRLYSSPFFPAFSVSPRPIGCRTTPQSPPFPLHAPLHHLLHGRPPQPSPSESRREEVRRQPLRRHRSQEAQEALPTKV
jgi:hypothetical protein